MESCLYFSQVFDWPWCFYANAKGIFRFFSHTQTVFLQKATNITHADASLGNEICSVNTSVEASLSIQQQPHVAVRGRRPYLPGDPASLGFYGKFFLFLTTTVAFSFVSSFTSSFYDMRIHSIGCSYVARTLIQALCNVCFMPISLDAQIEFPSFRFCLCSCGFQLLPTPPTLLLCSFLFYNRFFTSRLVLYFLLSLISIPIWCFSSLCLLPISP